MASEPLRLNRHPVLGDMDAGRKIITLSVDETDVEAYQGDILAAVLWQHGFLRLGLDASNTAARGMYCGIGHCCECRVTVNGQDDVRACLTPVREGMKVKLEKPICGKENPDAV